MGQKPSKETSGELPEPWRKFNWEHKEQLKTRLEMFHLSSPDVTHVKILVAGQIGAGKSSFINSVNSAFQGEIACGALADSTACVSRSFTRRLEGHRIRNADKDLPFKIYDIMGLEPEKISECQPDDVVKTIYGHVKEGYKFSEKSSIANDDQYYNESPSLHDQAFCLVYVIDANTFQISADDKILIEKLRTIREKISDEGIPQVIIMTKVDEACPLVQKDLKKIYHSKKIKEKIQMCSQNVGVPINSIFPVKNYHDEIDTDDDTDVLILKAFDQIVRSANERLRRGASNS